MSATIVVRIAVEQATFSFDKLYSYLWSPDFGTPQVGVRVLVPFGGGNRTRQGLVMEIAEQEATAGLKSVLSVLDPTPLLNEEMLQLARFMQERTFCTLFDAVRSMVPTGLYMQIKTVLRPAADVSPSELETLTPNERQILAFVSKCPGGADKESLLTRVGLDSSTTALSHLLEMGVLVATDEGFRHTGDATIRTARLLPQAPDAPAPKLTEKQQSVLSLLEDVGAASVKEVCYFCGVTQAVVSALARKGLIELYDAESFRAPYKTEDPMPPIVSQTLNEEQTAAFDRLMQLYTAGKPAAALLYGVTGSGKTAVYMNLIDKALDDNRQVIVLVPEISLTPQTMALFVKKYGKRVAVLHSSLAIGERMDEWKRIKRGEARIVVGTRSAIFAPCEDLGLIIMDEEQEHTYKSESSPRYHARDIARFRCAYHNALLVLASATPSVESYHAAKNGRYTLVELTRRYGDVQLPQVEVVDMRQESMGESVLGPTLLERMRTCLDEDKQVILLLNRRGFHTHVSCRSCGEVISCPSCSISLTYHRANDRLMCHYCGHSQRAPSRCPKCNSDKIRYSGLGTQLVEDELSEIFPDVPILRMDTDTTMSRSAYEEKFKAFANGEYGIMIGTQMVAKGLDFPKVGLVGVLSADQSLYSGDYRSYESTFALLTQVIGRAGRRREQGLAVIQTYTPENEVISYAAEQNYPEYYALEDHGRRSMHYPPYADLFMFGFTGVQEQKVHQTANRMMQLLRDAAMGEYGDLPIIALDATPAAVLRVSGKYRYKMLIKGRNTKRMRDMIRELMQTISKDPVARGVSVYVDVNPASVL